MTFEYFDMDSFAGAGGASLAMEWAGCAPTDALNHNDEALAVHAVNHPNCNHHREDILGADIVWIANGRRINNGWFSPDCTDHSKAKGGKPRNNKRRGLCWVIIDWIDRTGPKNCLMPVAEGLAGQAVSRGWIVVRSHWQFGDLGPLGLIFASMVKERSARLGAEPCAMLISLPQ